MDPIRRSRYISWTTATVILIFTMAFFGAYHSAKSEHEKLKRECEDVYTDLIYLKTRGGMGSEEDFARLRERVDEDKKRFASAINARQRKELELPEVRVPSRAEFYFEILETEKNLRALAEEYHVTLLDGGKFGFSDTLQIGQMSDGLLPLWKKELAKIDILVRLLYGASTGDLRFEAIARESSSTAELSLLANDLFDGRNILSLRPVLGCDTHLFQLKFYCHTATLRRFMNALEEFLLPVVPRLIRVRAAHGHNRANERGNWMVVDPKPVECTVVLEWVDLLAVGK
ncbi:MAG: Amuc_1100 family pilus-like protein [Puniceicoccales bacterium]|jgi:hypothetical protein|nr:Amuc_1100 family pilus-like protein [Puniceicoccales bacterium]